MALTYYSALVEKDSVFDARVNYKSLLKINEWFTMEEALTISALINVRIQPFCVASQRSKSSC